MDARKAALALGLILASCGAPKPRVAPAPPAAPPPPPAPISPPSADWRDLPVAAGTWRYAQTGSDSSATFGAGPAVPALVIRCLRASRTVTFLRAGADGPLSIRTSYGSRTLPASGGVASFAATDPFLDGIAFSRGRFTIEAARVPILVLPAWAEPGRVIEDCRS